MSLSFNLQLVIQGSKAASGDEYVELLESATALLQAESGRIGNFEVERKLVKLDPTGEALVIGDLHGDLESLWKILESYDNLYRLYVDPTFSVIFLGDYGDRGSHSPEVYYTILKLKRAYPNQVILLRGNHEGPEDLIASPHDLPLQLQYRFKDKGPMVYSKVRRLFDCLYNAVIVKDHFLMVHGGVSPKIKTIKDFAFAGSPDRRELLEDLLWNDPDENLQGVTPSPRGAGLLFGKDVTNTILDNFGLQILIRGHEPADEGYRIDHDGRVLTLFSRKGSPYFNTYGAYLNLPLSQEATNANQLVPRIHKF